eukprot:1094197-Pelagomonas_calceolata.AAC.1
MSTGNSSAAWMYGQRSAVRAQAGALDCTGGAHQQHGSAIRAQAPALNCKGGAHQQHGWHKLKCLMSNKDSGTDKILPTKAKLVVKLDTSSSKQCWKKEKEKGHRPSLTVNCVQEGQACINFALRGRLDAAICTYACNKPARMAVSVELPEVKRLPNAAMAAAAVLDSCPLVRKPIWDGMQTCKFCVSMCGCEWRLLRCQELPLGAQAHLGWCANA